MSQAPFSPIYILFLSCLFPSPLFQSHLSCFLLSFPASLPPSLLFGYITQVGIKLSIFLPQSLEDQNIACTAMPDPFYLNRHWFLQPFLDLKKTRHQCTEFLCSCPLHLSTTSHISVVPCYNKGAKPGEGSLIHIGSLYRVPSPHPPHNIHVHPSHHPRPQTQDAFQGTIQHLVVMFLQLILIVRVSENFIIFDDLDTLEEFWSGLSLNTLPLEFLCFSHH